SSTSAAAPAGPAARAEWAAAPAALPRDVNRTDGAADSARKVESDRSFRNAVPFAGRRNVERKK
ncbi:MAG: hypothetical protein IIW01_03900, partial [Thermoguttaceae bacterium]|nr:hypothetical protein [Thermoguttaceae bacterium]